MRHLLRTLIPALLIAFALAACAPSPTPPSSGVGRAIWRIRQQPPPTPTAEPSDRLCVEAYDERGDELPTVYADEVAAADPATTPLSDVLSPAMEAAADALDIPQSSFGVSTTTLSGGSTLVITMWCAPYAGQDIFVVSADYDTWPLVHITDNTRSVVAWPGDNTIVMWADAAHGLLGRQQVWIAEEAEDGSWSVVYEATHTIGPNDARPPELTLENQQSEATVDYTLESGERVVRTFNFSPGAVWTMTGEERTEVDAP